MEMLMMEKYIDLEMLNWMEINGNDISIINRNEFQEEDIHNLIWLAAAKNIKVVEKENQVIFID